MRYLAVRHAVFGVLFAAVLTGCASQGGMPAGKAAATPKATTGATDECSALTVADIKTITGADVEAVARGAFPGAGGTCGNYTLADGRPFLGVNVLESKGLYDVAVGAVPKDVYPVRETVAGLGDEAVLMKDRAEKARMRYLVAHKGDVGVVIFPFSGGDLTDDQLKQLAAKAIGAT
jgi:hypothetical protein